MRRLAFLAASLALGCSAPPPTSPAGSPSPVPASPVASAPAAVPSVVPVAASTAPAATTGPAAPASPSAVALETGVLSGRVFDQEFASVPDGTTVTVTSLNTAQPYTGSTTTAGGSYVLNQVPFQTQLAVTASRPGWTSRRQVVVLRPLDPRLNTRNELDFGGRSEANGGAAGSYFLSPYPEIAAVTPADEDASLPTTEMKLAVTLSEPLSLENQRRFAAAFRIVPNSIEALGAGEAIASALTLDEVEGLRIATTTGTLDAQVRYAYRQNSAFLGGLETSTFQWEDGGRKAVFRLKAPVKTGRTQGAQYAFLLVQRGTTRIEDAEGLPLGTDAEGDWGEALDGELLYNVIAEAGLTVSSGLLKGKERWADTHQAFTRFTLATDETAPRLVGVLARRNYLDDEGDAVDRLELTFSEPMMAYPRLVGEGVLRLDNYLVAAAETEAGLADRSRLRQAEGFTGLAGAASAAAVKAALKAGDVVRVETAQAVSSSFSLAFGVRDAAQVVLSMPAGSLPDEASYVAVRAGVRATGTDDALADPAGNELVASDAVVVGPIQ